MSDARERLRVALEIVDDDLPDGAYWAMLEEVAGLEPGDAAQMIGEDPEYFGFEDMDEEYS